MNLIKWGPFMELNVTLSKSAKSGIRAIDVPVS